MKNYFIVGLLFCSQLSGMDVEPYIDDAQLDRDSAHIIKLFQNDIDFLFHSPDQFNPEYIKWEIENKRVHSVWPIKEEDYEPPFYQKVLRRDTHLVGLVSYIVAKEDGRLKKTYSDQGKAGWLWQVCVDSSFRRKGYGKRMLESALSHLKMLDVETVSGFVRAYNYAAISLYQKLGFEQYQVLDKHNSLLFRKKL